MHEKQINLAGKTTVKQLAAVVRQCKLFIGNETGPMHIAASVGTPVISFFGPQVSDRFQPFSQKKIVLERYLDCKPCDQVICRRPEHPCMDGISVKDAIMAVEEILQAETESSTSRTMS